MINQNRFIAMAKKWQKLAALRRRRISLPRTKRSMDVNGCSKSVADKGHFVVYTADEKRYVIPLAYLTSNIFKELFKMSEEQFGLPKDGPITLPCDAIFMEYVISLVQRHPSKDLEKALLMSMATGRCSDTCPWLQGHINQHILVHSF